MNAYLVDQTQQMERAKTRRIRRIEERVSRIAQARPEVAPDCLAVRRPAARRRRAVVRCDAAV